ncbi:hypothetical protein ACH4CD_06425 [Streptomyces fungicidicus]|uniref:hypothetical protein n=1 Tax=Streptomyces fungicidicus TaxID=68203 RepID=UPI0037AC8DD2
MDGGLPRAGPHGERWRHILHSGFPELRAGGFPPCGRTTAVATGSDLSLWTRATDDEPSGGVPEWDPPLDDPAPGRLGA